MSSKPFYCFPFWLLAIALPLVLAGCGEEAGQQAANEAAKQAPTVEVTAAETQPVEQLATFVGRVVAIDKVELLARVEGFLKERKFTEGHDVAVGDLLFEIEPDQYQAIVEQREADLAKAKADQQNTAAQLKRGLELLKDKNIAQAKVDEAIRRFGGAGDGRTTAGPGHVLDRARTGGD
jgi:membrane fusion protein (multidrug efflux system)